VKFAGLQLRLRIFPALGVFRNGHFLAYNGSMKYNEDILTWLVDKDTLELKGQVKI
jgi:hypothetical protein